MLAPELDTFYATLALHVMCHVRRRIHACHVSCEEEDTCMSCVV
jgi:hypothetical protein